MSYENNGLVLKSNIIPVQTDFIEKIMPSAPPAFSLVYLFALSKCINKEPITNEEIAKNLSLLESDVVNAWKYFQEKNVIDIDEKNNTINFLDISIDRNNNICEKTSYLSKKPEYSPDEIALYSEKSKDVKELFLTAQNYLGRLLSYNDMQILFGIYDWLALPLNVIEILLAYAAKIGKTSMSYIEKIAISWADENINTPEKALQKIDTYNKKYKQILKSFGILDRLPVESEKMYIKKWTDDFGFSIDIICLACEKTILQTSKASFPYADKILENWHKNNVSSVDDILKLEENYKNSKQNLQKPLEKQPIRESVKNKFVNYEQRNWDFEKLRELEKQFMDKELKKK